MYIFLINHSITVSMIKLFFFFLKGQSLSSCFSCWFLSDSAEYLKQTTYFLSHFLYLKNGLHLFISSLCLSRQSFGTLYKLSKCHAFHLSFRRCFRFLSGYRERRVSLSRGIIGFTTQENFLYFSLNLKGIFVSVRNFF